MYIWIFPVYKNKDSKIWANEYGRAIEGKDICTTVYVLYQLYK